MLKNKSLLVILIASTFTAYQANAQDFDPAALIMPNLLGVVPTLDSPAASSTNSSELTEAIMFTPPPGWRNTDQSALPKHVQVMVVGKGAFDFPPSISLGSEDYKGTLKQYLKRIKDINTSKGYVWKDLGNVKTEAGNASLSQVDKKTEWGEVKMMHVIFIKNDTVYILTAASLKDEFPKFYRDFFNSLKSLRFRTGSKTST